jgi:hypothetical protein
MGDALIANQCGVEPNKQYKTKTEIVKLTSRSVTSFLRYSTISLEDICAEEEKRTPHQEGKRIKSKETNDSVICTPK